MSKNFYFDKTDLFRKLDKVEDVLGISDSGTNITVVASRIDAIEETLSILTSDYAKRNYVDTKLLEKINKAGDQILGNLELLISPVQPNHIVHRQFVENLYLEISNELDSLEELVRTLQTTYSTTDYVNSEVSQLTENINFLSDKIDILNIDPTTQTYVDTVASTKMDVVGGNYTGPIYSSRDPISDLELATKRYVDTVAAGLKTKPSVRLATLTNVEGNFVDGVLTGLANLHLMLDGKLVNQGDRVALLNQATSNQNGCYDVRQTGSLDEPFILERSELTNTSDEIPGSYFIITDGVNLKSTGWVFIVNDQTTFTINTDPIQTVQFFGNGSLIAGTGITIEGTTLNVNTASASRIVINNDNIDLAKTGISAGTYSKLIVDEYGRVIGSTLLIATDIPNLSWSKITSGKPTTLSGYGITDGVKKSGDTLTGYLVLHANPTLAMHPATKQYTDNSIQSASALLTTQDSNLQVQINNINSIVTALNTDPVSKTYVDDMLLFKFNKTGGAVTGPISLPGSPTDPLHATTKSYTDLHDSELDVKFTNLTSNLQNQLTVTTDIVNNLNADSVTKTYVTEQDALKVNKTGDNLSGYLNLHADPIQPLHPSTKQYTDNQVQILDTNKVNKDGDTLTGYLVLHDDPINNLHPTSKQYVDNIETNLESQIITIESNLQTQITNSNAIINQLNNDPVTKNYVDTQDNLKVNKTGDSISGHLLLEQIPTLDLHATNKAYVDSVAKNLHPRLSVRVLIKEPLAAIYNNGTNGIDATLTGTNIGTLSSDDILLNVNDRVLVASSDNSYVNGPYIVIRNNASSTFLLKRTNENNESNEIPGSLFYIEEGTNYKKTSWTCIVNNTDTFTIGVDNINVTQSGAMTNYIVGNGLLLDGNLFSINLKPGSGLVFDNSRISFKLDGASLTQSDDGVKLSESLQSILNDSVSKSGTSNITGSVIFESDSELKSNITPIVNNDVVNKAYSDSKDTILQNQISQANSTINSLSNTKADISYVDSQDSLKINKAGDTLTGYLNLHADPISATHPVTKAYADNIYTTLVNYSTSEISTKVNKTGDSLTGYLVLHADPTSSLHPATKNYVDINYTTLYNDLSPRINTAQTQITLLQTVVNTLNTDPVTKQYVDVLGSNKVNKSGDTLTGYLNLHADPVQALHPTTKQYTDNLVTNLNADNLKLGTIPSARLPSFNGDVVSIAGSSTLTLKPSSVTPGTYTKITIGVNGLPTSAGNIEATDIPNLDWSKITSGRPSTADGYGITDVLKLSGGTMTGDIILRADPTASLHPVTKNYADTLNSQKLDKTGGTLTGPLILNNAPTNSLEAVTKQYVDSQIAGSAPIGTIILSSQSDTPDGYLRCSGAKVYSELYPELAATLYNKTNIVNYGAGKHWRQQYFINKGSNVGNFTFVTATSLPQTLNNHKVCVINNNNILVTGGNVTSSTYSNVVYLGTIDTGHVIRAYTNIGTLPISVAGHELVVYGNYIYLIGGQTSSGPSTAVYRSRFNVDQKTLTEWELISTLPYGVYNHSALILNDRIYVLGGNASSTTLTQNIISTDIKQDMSLGNWVYTGILPMTCKDFSIAITKNKIYIIGGNTSASSVTSISDVYSTDYLFSKWTTEISLPVAMCIGTCIVIRDMLYIIGNYTTTVTRNIYYASIDKAGNLGKFIQSSQLLPSATCNHELAIIGNKLHLIGGLKSNGSPGNTVYYTDFVTTEINYNYNFTDSYTVIGYGHPDQYQNEFNEEINTLTFTEFGTLPSALYNGCSVVTNNHLYIIGASTSLTNSVTTNIYHYVINPDGSLTYSNLLTAPIAVTMTSALLYNNYLYLFGGYNGTSSVNSIYRCPINVDGTLGTWVYLSDLPIAISGHTAIMVKDRVYIISGYTSTGINTNIYSATIINGSSLSPWTIVSQLPITVTGIKPFIIRDRLYLIGGRNGNLISNKVYYCLINTDGTLDQWLSGTNFPTNIANYTVVTTTYSIFIIGGSSLSMLNTVYKSNINLDGTITNWSLSGNISPSLGLSGTMVSICNNYLYLLGGYNGTSLINTIYQSTFTGGKNNYIESILPINSAHYKTPYLFKDQSQFNINLINNLYSFENTSTFPINLQNSEVLVTANYCYTLGGNQGGTSSISTIYQATITDGVLSNFSTNSINLPISISKHRAIILGNILHIFGGVTTGTTSTANCYTNNIPGSGTIVNSFNAGNALPKALDSFAVAVTSSRVYIFGGSSNNVLSNNVYYADILSNNMLSSWVTGTNLPVAIKDHKVILINSYLYLIGGITTNQSNIVYRAKVNNDGSIGSFIVYGKLPIPLSNYELISIHDAIFLIGGFTTNNVIQPSIYKIPIQSNDTIGTGVDVNGFITGIETNIFNLPYGLANSSCIITSKKLYAIAGMSSAITNNILSCDFIGGKDNYLHTPYNTIPIMFKLPDFTDTNIDMNGYNYYIKY